MTDTAKPLPRDRIEYARGLFTGDSVEDIVIQRLLATLAKAEAERDEARALLREARGVLSAITSGVMDYRIAGNAIFSRIDAYLRAAEGCTDRTGDACSLNPEEQTDEQE